MVRQKKRTSKKQRQWTADELSALMLLHQQRAIRLDHLPAFLALLNGKADDETTDSKSSRHNLAERFQRAGLIHLQQLDDRQSWIWLTRRGMQQIGVSTRKNRPLRRMLYTLHAANTVRLLLAEHDPQALWMSQEEIRSTILPFQQHRAPLAELHTARGEHIALYIALRLGETEEQIATRLQEQLEQERGPGKPAYTALWYYASANPARQLRAARARIAASSREVARRISVFSYPHIHNHIIYRGHRAPVRALVWSPDGAWVASTCEEKILHVWDAATGQEHMTKRLPAPVSIVQWSRAGSWIVLGDEEGRISVQDSASGAVQQVLLDPQSNPISGLACSPLDNDVIAFCSRSDWHGIYDLQAKRLQWDYNGSFAGAEALAWSPDGTQLAIGSSDGSVHLFAATTGKRLRAYQKHRTTVQALAWSSDSHVLASAGEYATVVLWDAVTGKKQRTLLSAMQMVSVLAWSPDGTRLAIAGHEPQVQIWNAITGRLLYTYEEHADEITGLAWSADSTRLASASKDQTVYVYPIGDVSR